MTVPRIALLIGGPSSQHKASLAAASDILEHQPSSVHLHPVLITPTGQWRLYPSSLGYSADTPQYVLAGEQVLEQLPYLYDAAFLAMSGEYSSDGQIQRLLDRAGLPYQGSGPRASIRTSDTAATYQYLRRLGFHIPSYLVLTRAEWVVARGRKLRQIVAVMGTDLIVKPNASGVAGGLTTRTAAQLADAIEEISVQHDRFIIQRQLDGIRVSCAVIESDAGPVPGQPIASDQTVSPETALALQRTALRVHQVLGLSDYSQTDLTVAHGRIWVTGIQTLPSLAASSAFVRSATHLGWKYPELMSHLISRALHRPEVIELH